MLGVSWISKAWCAFSDGHGGHLILFAESAVLLAADILVLAEANEFKSSLLEIL